MVKDSKHFKFFLQQLLIYIYFYFNFIVTGYNNRERDSNYYSIIIIFIYKRD